MSAFELPGELIPGSTGYICVICEITLITTMETSCKHKFCKHCIGLWKKHNGFCPICTHEIGTLVERPDIDDLIDGFFGTADAISQQARIDLIRSRNEASESMLGNSKGNEMKALMDFLKPPPTALDAFSSQLPPRTGTASGGSGTDKKKEIDRLRRENEKFERELNMIYSKILTTGERMTAREDILVSRLCGTPVLPTRSVFCLPREIGKMDKSCRPHTVAGNFVTKDAQSTLESSKLSGMHVATACTTKTECTGPPPGSQKLPKEQSEIEVLLELTDDVLRIDTFLNTFNFDTMTQSERITEDTGIDDQEDALSIVNDESLQSTTDDLAGKSDDSNALPNMEFKVHPEVLKYLDKHGLSVELFVPKSQKTFNIDYPTDYEGLILDDPDSGTAIHREFAKIEAGNSFQGTAAGVTMSGKSSVDLTSKILQCRESLLNLKEKGEHETHPKMRLKTANLHGRVSPDNDYDWSSSGPMENSTVGLRQRPHGDGDTVRWIGREPVRPPTRSIMPQLIPHFPQMTAPFKTKRSGKPSKEEIGTVASVPAITNRKLDKNKDAGNRARPYTAVERRKPVVGNTGFPR